MEKNIQAPFKKEELKMLRAGDYVKITGTIYTARDAAHKRLSEALEKGEKLPVEIEGITIYYLGPTPAREGKVIGSAGPTTSSRIYTQDAGSGYGGNDWEGKENERGTGSNCP